MLQNQSVLAFDKSFTKKLKIAIVRTNYHGELIDNLESYARRTLIDAGVTVKNIKTYTVPGSWEIPLIVKKAAESKKFNAIIAFGIIVKGQTYHFDLIANEVASALMQLSIDYSTPIAFEVLAVYDKEHAAVRAGQDEYNKGIEAANAALQTILTLQSIR